MTVKDVILKLQQLDPGRQVIIQKDPEGNGYSPFACVWTGTYQPTTTWDGEARFEQLTQELIEAGYTEEDVSDDGQRAAFLCPVN